MPSPHHFSMPSPPRRRLPRDAPRMLPRVRKASPRYEPSSPPDLKRPRPDLHRPDLHRPDLHRPDFHRPDLHRSELHRLPPDVAPATATRWPSHAPPTPPTANVASLHSPAAGLSPTPVPHAKSRRLYIGNLPFHAGLTDFALSQFFSALYVAAYGALAPGTPLPVLSFWLHSDGKFGFMELRTEQHTLNMMQFNGVLLHGRPLRVNRPSDYRPEIHNPSAAPLSQAAMNAHAVVDLCNQLTGIVSAPAHVSAIAASTPRPPEPTAPVSVSPAAEPDTTTVATPPCASASASAATSAAAPAAASAAASAAAFASVPAHGLPSTPASAQPQTRAKPEPQPLQLRSQPSTRTNDAPQRDTDAQLDGARIKPEVDDDVKPLIQPNQPLVVILLRNLVTDEDLTAPPDDFAVLMEDVQDECSNYGAVSEVNIPRDGPHKGTAFVQFADPRSAQRAITALAKRVFDDRKITALGVRGCRTASEAAGRSVLP